MPVCDKDLRTVDLVVVAILFRIGLYVLEVRARSRLGHGNRRNAVAADQFRQPLFLLFLTAICVEIMDYDGLDPIAPTRITGAALLVNGNRVEPDAATEPAIFFGNRATHDALFTDRTPEIAINDPLIRPFFDIRCHFSIEKLAGGVREHLVFICGPGRTIRDQRHVGIRLSWLAFSKF